MTIRRLAAALSVVALLAALAVMPVTAGAPASAYSTGIKSVTAITDIYTFGQKVSGVAVEYYADVNSRELALDTFTVADSTYNFRFDTIDKLDVLANRTITNIYTNNKPTTITDGTPVAGHFVIVELSPLDYGGDTIRTDVNTAYVTINKDLRTQVVQNKNVYAQPGGGVGLGMLLSTASATVYKPTSRTNLWADDWKTESYCCSGGVFLPYQYHLPANYDPNHLYPMVVIFPGQGMGYDGTNLGTNVVADIPATAWLRPEWKGTNEDVIVLAPQSIRTGSTAEASLAYTVISNFMKQYSVDPQRLYVSTVSWGSTTAWAMMSSHPGFVSALLLTGGFAVSTSQATNIAKDLTPIWITHGLHDPLLPVATTGRVSRDRLRAAYVAAGVDQATAENLVRYTEFDTPAYFNQVTPLVPGYAEPDNHAVMGPTYSTTEILQWLLAQVH